jgi:hypothetical protein
MRSWWVGPLIAGVLVLTGCSQEKQFRGTAAGSATPAPATSGPVVVSAEENGDSVQALTNEEADRMDAINLAGARHPKAFGGSWWDLDTNEPVAFVVDAPGADGLTARLAKLGVRTEVGDFSERALQGYSVKLLMSLGPDRGVEAVAVDVQRNGLSVEVEEHGVERVIDVARRRKPEVPPITQVVIWEEGSGTIFMSGSAPGHPGQR